MGSYRSQCHLLALVAAGSLSVCFCPHTRYVSIRNIRRNHSYSPLPSACKYHSQSKVLSHCSHHCLRCIPACRNSNTAVSSKPPRKFYKPFSLELDLCSIKSDYLDQSDKIDWNRFESSSSLHLDHLYKKELGNQARSFWFIPPGNNFPSEGLACSTCSSIPVLFCKPISSKTN